MKNQSTKIDYKEIAGLLTRSTEQLDSHIVSALGRASALALQKQRMQEPVFSLHAIGHRAHNLVPHSRPQWFVTVALLGAILAGVATYWQNSQVPLDIDILTDDLPIEVFVDK
jgi:hypothetical protein